MSDALNQLACLRVLLDLDGASLIDHHPDTEAIAHDLQLVREVKVALADAERVLEAFVAETLPGGELEVDGLGLVRREWRSASYRWQGIELATRVAQLAAAERGLLDTETGERAPAYDDVMEVVAAVLEVCSVGYGRVGAMRRLELDPDEWRSETSPGRNVVRVFG